jgi:hypothetical protein
MPFWTAFFYVLLGLLIVLLPIGLIGLSASRLTPGQQAASFFLYGAAVLLLAIVAFDVTEALPVRGVVDLALLAGGIALGFAAGRLWRVLRPGPQPPDAS